MGNEILKRVNSKISSELLIYKVELVVTKTKKDVNFDYNELKLIK